MDNIYYNYANVTNGDYVISTEGVPIKLHITVEGDKATYRDGSVGDVHDLQSWAFEEVEPMAVYEPDPEATTCFVCKDKDICKYAFDAYNTNGDCLASK